MSRWVPRRAIMAAKVSVGHRSRAHGHPGCGFSRLIGRCPGNSGAVARYTLIAPRRQFVDTRATKVHKIFRGHDSLTLLSLNSPPFDIWTHAYRLSHDMELTSANSKLRSLLQHPSNAHSHAQDMQNEKHTRRHAAKRDSHEPERVSPRLLSPLHRLRSHSLPTISITALLVAARTAADHLLPATQGQDGGRSTNALTLLLQPVEGCSPTR